MTWHHLETSASTSKKYIFPTSPVLPYKDRGHLLKIHFLPFPPFNKAFLLFLFSVDLWGEETSLSLVASKKGEGQKSHAKINVFSRRRFLSSAGDLQKNDGWRPVEGWAVGWSSHPLTHRWAATVTTCFMTGLQKKKNGTDSPVRAGWAGPHLLHELLANSLLSAGTKRVL